MKRCPYCGKEYPDDVVSCALDAYLLLDPLSGKEQKEVVGEPMDTGGAIAEAEVGSKRQSGLVYPDFQWSARDGWKCLGTLLVIGFVSGVGVLVLDKSLRPFHNWRWGGLGYFSHDLLRDVVFLLTAAYFARTKKLATFLSGFGLNRKPSDRVWF
ncbi:MAG: hypothetical protein DME25_20665, partial [Verrucomicrobia bacterium]